MKIIKKSSSMVDCRSVRSELLGPNLAFVSRVPPNIVGENTPKEQCQNRILQELKKRLKELE